MSVNKACMTNSKSIYDYIIESEWSNYLWILIRAMENETYTAEYANIRRRCKWSQGVNEWPEKVLK